MTLKGMETGAELTLKVTGMIAKDLSTFLYAVLTGAKQVKGKASLLKMLKTGKELKTFSIRTDDLKLFIEKAKERGVLFHVIKDLDPLDDITEIMTTSDHAETVASIAERFKLATVRETATIQSEYKEKPGKEKDTPADKSAEDFMAFLNEKFEGSMDIKDAPKQERPDAANPTLAAGNLPQQNPSKSSSGKAEGRTGTDARPSTREQLTEIKMTMREKTSTGTPPAKGKSTRSTKPAKSKPPKEKKVR